MAANFGNEEFDVHVDLKYGDQPVLTIPGWGYIRLFYSGHPPHWEVHMIDGERDGAGTVLYFAALWWIITKGDKMLEKYGHEPTGGKLSSGLTLSPDAVRARIRMVQQYGDYIYRLPHPDPESVKVHRNDGTDWRRPATPEESDVWRLKKEPPFEFNFR